MCKSGTEETPVMSKDETAKQTLDHDSGLALVKEEWEGERVGWEGLSTFQF